jgi:hypothetical protein
MSNPKYDLYKTKEGTSKRQVTDWFGKDLGDEELNKLQEGDCVRLRLMDKEPGTGWEMIYFEITDISYYSRGGTQVPRTFHGKAMDTYRLNDKCYVRTGEIISFQKDNICEIPGWKAGENPLPQENAKKIQVHNDYVHDHSQN